MNRTNRANRIKSAEFAEAIYAHILEHGPTSTAKLAEVAGCSRQTTDCGRMAWFNTHMRNHKHPHLFRKAPKVPGTRTVRWMLIERNLDGGGEK